MTASISPPPTGTPIHAAAAGTVTYAGDELKNYGNLVLIKHDGGYVTAYAHADRLIVSRGDCRHQGPGDRLCRPAPAMSPRRSCISRSATTPTPVNPRPLLMARNS